MTTLYIGHYHSKTRANELEHCLRANLENDYIDRIVVISEAPELLPEHPKLIVEPQSRRATYGDFFGATRRLSRPCDTNILANSDIYFDDSIATAQTLDLTAKCLTLLRWSHVTDGRWELQSWGSRGVIMNNSQDVWIFRGAVPPFSDCEFSMGVPACDNHLAWVLQNVGYSLFNPCFEIKSYHYHKSTYRPGNRGWVRGNRAYVSPCSVEEIRQINGVISFSLFGNEPKYTTGAIRNAELAPMIYPGWKVRIYHDDSVPMDCIDRLQTLGVQLMAMPRQRHKLQGAFWRFLVADDQAAPRWIVRDVDSRLNHREAAAVNEWALSGKGFHVMRDHPHHKRPIVACGFGGKRGVIKEMAGRIGHWDRVGFYGADEQFLAEKILPLVRNNMLVHDSFMPVISQNVRRFPTERSDFEFVGERIDENDEPDLKARAIIAREEAGSVAAA